jgi:vacuolar-type H+-ATPase subunit D/Vma8
LKKKKNLDERITKLKEAIADETKKLSEAKTSCGILNNNIDETMRRFH